MLTNKLYLIAHYNLPTNSSNDDVFKAVVQDLIKKETTNGGSKTKRSTRAKRKSKEATNSGS